MASNLPIPAPPRTPTPPTPVPEQDDVPAAAFGSFNSPAARGDRYPKRQSVFYDPNSLAPLASPQFGSLSQPLYSPTFRGSGPSAMASNEHPAAAPQGSSSPVKNPFNFQTQTISAAPVTKSNVGQRRGHRYKHSSISTQHQIFLEPPPRPPLALPASLPIPTFKEARRSMSKEQGQRITWCLCHALVAAYVLWSASGSLSMTALSHLVFFDAISATICVAVDVLCNFEVWKRSSIRHPFGLERVEVLASFAMSVFLLFMGFDLMSHDLKHMLESLGSHAPHHPHAHTRISPGSVDTAALMAIMATLVSAIGLKNHARISKAMRFSYIESLPSILSNPAHFLTLSCSGIMLLLPLLSISFYHWTDRLFCSVIALSMFGLGMRLAMAQGYMLLMSLSGPTSSRENLAAVVEEIQSEPAVTSVEEARFWQVHYGLYMANLKLCVSGVDDTAASKLRDRVATLIKNRLGGGGYGKGGSEKWEVTTQLTMLDAKVGLGLAIG